MTMDVELNVGDLIETRSHTRARVMYVGRGVNIIRFILPEGPATEDSILRNVGGWTVVCEHPAWALMPNGARVDLNAVQGAHWCPFCGEKVR